MPLEAMMAPQDSALWSVMTLRCVCVCVCAFVYVGVCGCGCVHVCVYMYVCDCVVGGTDHESRLQTVSHHPYRMASPRATALEEMQPQ